MIKTTKKHNIINPAKWVGKYVRHMANWRKFECPQGTNLKAEDDYFVCEWTGKLTRLCDEAYYGDYFETKEQAEAAGFDECYWYCEEGLHQIWQRANRKAA